MAEKKNENPQVEDSRLSSDAARSTYSKSTDVPKTNPPAGPQVVQEPGKVSE